MKPASILLLASIALISSTFAQAEVAQESSKQVMTEGKYHLFLLAFSPRLRAELIRGARETETRVPVLDKWEPAEQHLAALKKKDGTQQ